MQNSSFHYQGWTYLARGFAERLTELRSKLQAAERDGNADVTDATKAEIEALQQERERLRRGRNQILF
jgi:hypothetical protein